MIIEFPGGTPSGKRKRQRGLDIFGPPKVEGENLHPNAYRERAAITDFLQCLEDEHADYLAERIERADHHRNEDTGELEPQHHCYGPLSEYDRGRFDESYYLLEWLKRFSDDQHEMFGEDSCGLLRIVLVELMKGSHHEGNRRCTWQHCQRCAGYPLVQDPVAS